MTNGEKSIHIITKFNKTQELSKTLGLDETLQMLMALMESPQQYKQIFYQTSLSDPTLSRRLKILQTLNIIKKQPIRSKKRATHAYALTLTGEKLMKFIEAYEKETNLSLEQQKIIEIES